MCMGNLYYCVLSGEGVCYTSDVWISVMGVFYWSVIIAVNVICICTFACVYMCICTTVANSIDTKTLIMPQFL